MAENKFIERLQGKDTEKAVLEIKKSNSKTSFANMTEGTSDATIVYSDSNNDATAVLKNAINWKIISRNLDLSNNVSGDGDDVVGYDEVAGISDTQGNNLWINSSYTVPAGGMVFTKNTKWVLKLCGDNLIENGGSSIGFTVIISLGNSNIITKTFTVSEQATFFCKELVIDFAESNSSVIRLAQSDKITLKLLSNSANASARIYQGMTTLTALQRRVDSDAVSSNTRTFDDMEEDVDDLLDNVDYLQGHIIVKSSTMPTASVSLVGEVYQYTGATVYPYEHGYIYECVQSSPGVYSWQRMDVQPGGSRGRFLSLWNCATGLAVTNPPISPYEYKAGDYFIVSNVSSGTNYKPTGTEYVIGTASTVVESSEVFVDDTYFFDGTTWKLQNTSNDIKALVDTKVNKDGTSVMTGPLKFRAGSFVGAIAGGLGDGISFYKLKSDNTIDSEVASLTKTNGFLPGTTNSTNIGSSSLKWKDAYIGRVITSVLNNGANINVPTTSGTMALTSDIAIKSTEANISNPANGQLLSYDSNTSKWVNATVPNMINNITNCITEIPQDIKLELNNGTLTLKAGSKVYVPNSAGVFDIHTVASDISRTFSVHNATVLIFLDTDNLTAPANSVADCTSGTTAPSGSGTFYDTSANTIRAYTSGTPSAHKMSFPFAQLSFDSGGNCTIDQVFNGFGYIGSTVFALPGTTQLIPNGFNADGTLNNTKITANTVQTRTLTATVSDAVLAARFNAGTPFGISSDAKYDESRNINVASGVDWNYGFIGTISTSSGKITSFTKKQVFHAVDYTEFQHVKEIAEAVYTDAVLISTPQTIKSLKTLSRADIGQDEILKITTPNTGVKSEINYYDASTQNKLATQYFQKSGTEYHFAMAGWDPTLNVASGGIYLVGKQVGANWTWHAEAPTPALSDDSSKIATTEWVRDLFSGGFSMPDYSSLVDNISNPYTPTVNGYIIASRSGTYGNIWVKNNTHDVQIAAINCTDSDSSTQIVMVIANKGEEYSFSPSNATAKFVPAKGE